MGARDGLDQEFVDAEPFHQVVLLVLILIQQVGQDGLERLVDALVFPLVHRLFKGLPRLHDLELGPLV